MDKREVKKRNDIYIIQRIRITTDLDLLRYRNRIKSEGSALPKVVIGRLRNSSVEMCI